MKTHPGRPLHVLLSTPTMPDVLWVYLRRVPPMLPADWFALRDFEEDPDPRLAPGHILCLESIVRLAHCTRELEDESVLGLIRCREI